MTTVFYSPSYVVAAHSFDTTRKAQWVADSLDVRAIDGIQLRAPSALTEDEVVIAHEREYVRAVKSGSPARLATSQGFPWDPALWTGVVASNGGVVAAAREALRSGVSGSLSSGLHHAAAANGNGFCTFNGLAIAARSALAAGAKRVLILDLDAHCGGGTYSIVGGDEGITQIDVSVDPFDRYRPSGKNTLDVVEDASSYLAVVRRRLDEAAETFDLCLYNAGMDPFERCAIGGLRGITTAVLEERERIVFEWCARRAIPIAFALAGGYVGPDLGVGELVDLHRLTLAAARESSRNVTCR